MSDMTWCPCFQAWQPKPNQCDPMGCPEMSATVADAIADAAWHPDEVDGL